MTHQDQITFETRAEGEMHDLTREVGRVVEESGIQTGVVHVFNIGSTASIGTIEFESGLVHDLPTELSRLFPPGTHYGHEQAWHDGNGHSHLQATVLGPDLTVPVANGAVVLGTWQQIFHLECDVKPRKRTVVITVMGD